MGVKIAWLVFLLAGSCAYAVLAWATGGSLALPPQEVVGRIRVVDRAGGRMVVASEISRSLAQTRANSTGPPRARKSGSGSQVDATEPRRASGTTHDIAASVATQPVKLGLVSPDRVHRSILAQRSLPGSVTGKAA